MTEQGYDGTETLFGTNAGRAAFADAGRAMRASLDAALTADPPLVQTEWKVLAAVLQETGTYSRVRSRLSVRALSLRTRVPFETARAAVDRLQAVGAIAFLARGPGKTPIVSLQTARPQAANPRGNRASSGGESARQPAGDPDSPARPQAANPRATRSTRRVLNPRGKETHFGTRCSRPSTWTPAM